MFPASATDAQKMAFFTNLKAGDPPAAGVKSYDYSLQLGTGVKNFPPTPPLAPNAPPGAVPAPEEAAPGFNPRAGEPDPHQPADGGGPDPERKGPAAAPPDPVPGPPWWTWWAVGGGIGLVVVIAILVFRGGRANSHGQGSPA